MEPLRPQLRLHEGQAEAGRRRGATTPSGPAPFLPPPGARKSGDQEESPPPPGSPQPRSDRSPSPPQPPRELSGPGSPSAGPGAGSVPEGAAPLCGAPRPDLLPRRRLRPTSGACVLLPGGARPPLRVQRRRLLGHRTSSRAAEARTVAAAVAPRSPPGAASPGDTFPAGGCGRPAASRPSAPAAGPGCRPEAWSGHDSLPGAPWPGALF